MIAVGSYRPGLDITGRFRYLNYWNKFCLTYFYIFLLLRPVNVVSYEREVEEYRQPFSSHQEEHIDQDMENILRQHQWVQTVALINGVFVIGFKLIESNNLKQKPFSLYISKQSSPNLHEILRKTGEKRR